MSSALETSQPEDTPKPEESLKEAGQVPHLGVLEEDDEFEEFPVQGERGPRTFFKKASLNCLSLGP
jgi:hypothetical protein